MMSERQDFAIFVFSFNRGEFLKNCVQSIERCARDLPVYIVDDGSTDLETNTVLNILQARYRVLTNSNARDIEKKTGGLSMAMNMAMEIALRDGFSFAIFIQDDMQFVRSVTNKDYADYRQYFSAVPNTIQLSNNFIRKLSMDRFAETHRIAEEAGAYIRFSNAERGKSSFSATGVFSVKRFFDLFHAFDIGEGANSEKAKRLGLICGRAINPNMCWLPYPRSYRGKKRNWKHRFFEYYGHSGYYPIAMMSEQEAEQFVQRPADIYPVMEQFLSSASVPRSDIWSTGGGEYNFLAYGGKFARLFKSAKAAKRFLAKAIA